MKTVIIVPTYNERENIGRLIDVVEGIIAKLPSKFETHILVVDDTSPDGTAKEVQASQKKYKNLHLLINQKKAGLGGAYLKGMEYAVKNLGAEVLMEFDADFSHDPKKIPAFLNAIEAGSDLVLGSRYIKGGTIPADWGWHRKFLSVMGNITIRIIMTNFTIKDWTTGYRAIRREVYESVKKAINRERFFGYTFQIGFLHQAIRQGYKVSEVPINFIDRTHGKSKLGPEYIKNTLIFIIRTRVAEIIRSRLFKFAFVGGVGAVLQIISANVLAGNLTQSIKIASVILSLPDVLAIEIAVVSNFILNNIWTFADRKLAMVQYVPKFIQFNIASLGSIGIQTVVIGLGLGLIGLRNIFSLPITGTVINSRTIFHITGILIGMFWNFFAYNKFIWKKK